MKFSLTSLLLAVSPAAVFALNADQQGALNAHNAARATKGLPALKWDDSLAASALQCANKIASSGNFAHCQAAENLWGRSAIGTNALTDAAKSWVSESANYHGEKIPDGNFGSYGHYST
jgi:pathogenesis-related protein 1